jgi:chloride channel 2
MYIIFIRIIIIEEAIYGIIGAAAMAGGVTRTTSVAMIVFELNGQTTHMIPVLIGVLMSYAVANALAMSIFDVILEMKNIPFLPTLTSVSTYNKTAGDLMN